MKEGYKNLFQTMWANYEYLNPSFVRQYFKADCDTMATIKVHKKNLRISVFAVFLGR